MNGFWYRLLVHTARICGSWLFIVVSRIIAAGYFMFSGRVPESRRFYAALYPQRGRLYHLWCTFLQYQNFTTIHFDRFLAPVKGKQAGILFNTRLSGTQFSAPLRGISASGNLFPSTKNKEIGCKEPIKQTQSVTFTSLGWERLEAVIGNEGGILLMSHLGNWEMAANLLKQQRDDLKLLLYMGAKEKEGIERMQKDELRRSGITIISADQKNSSPFSAVEGIRFLQAGGLVSMAGDIVWRDDQRKVRVTFLGHDAYLPEAPFVFALVSGAPLFAFFAFRVGRNSYQFSLSDPIAIRSKSRQDRPRAISQAAQQYADLLAQSLQKHPFEWYHFDRFIH